MFDSLLEFVVVAIPTIAAFAWPSIQSSVGTMKSNSRQRFTYIAMGLLFSCVLFFQQHRTRASHEEQVQQAAGQIAELKEHLKSISENNSALSLQVAQSRDSLSVQMQVLAKTLTSSLRLAGPSVQPFRQPPDTTPPTVTAVNIFNQEPPQQGEVLIPIDVPNQYSIAGIDPVILSVPEERKDISGPVAFHINGKFLGEDRTAPYSITVQPSQLPAGQHQLTATTVKDGKAAVIGATAVSVLR